ncbi:MAG: T9SS type A sorting domain-containing protein [Chitinophagaceae bacterium]
MKTIVPVIKRIGLAMPMLVIAGLLATFNFSAYSSKTNYNGPTALIRDTILVQKQLISKKIKIKLYPNANHQVLFFSASGDAGKVYQLFLFDIDGKLIKQVNIRNKQTTVLNRIDKGSYSYEVFSDDERIENGQVMVK